MSEKAVSPNLSGCLVECPYCDGENVVSPNPSAEAKFQFQDREIACRHCQCLFLLSESKAHGARNRPPDAA